MVEEFEVRHLDTPPQARRALEHSEFTNVLSLVRKKESKGAMRYKIGSVLTLQWHLIACIEDMMKLRFADFSANTQFPSTLICQMRRPKNTTEERDASEQIVFGSMDPRMCPLLNLTVYIETSVNIAESEFVYGNPDDGGRVVRRFLQDIFTHQDFHRLKEGNLGTYSFRKGASTYGSRSGMMRHHVKRRGRGRDRKTVGDAHIGNTQLYPDASVATALAGPSGPYFYVLKSDLPGITTQLLVNDIAPTVKHVMGESIARTLALPLLWAALQPRHAFEQELLPDRLRERIVGAYVGAGGNAEINPVEREAFRVSGDGAELNLVVLRDEASHSIAPDPAAALSESDGGGGSLRRELAALQSQIFSLHRSMMEYMKELMREVLRSRHECHCDSQRNLAILRRVATPAVARQVVREDQREDTGSEDTTRTPSSQHALVARLSKRPKDLYALWYEYEFGEAGLKPAKDFTEAEHGAKRYTYCRRKVFWDVVRDHVRAGYTSNAAIDRVYNVYGPSLAVSSILKAIREDKHRGGHPSLRCMDHNILGSRTWLHCLNALVKIATDTFL